MTKNNVYTLICNTNKIIGDNIITDKNISTLLIIVFIFYIIYVIPKLKTFSPRVRHNIIKHYTNPIYKLLMLSLIVYVSKIDITLALIIAIAFICKYQTIHKMILMNKLRHHFMTKRLFAISYKSFKPSKYIRSKSRSNKSRSNKSRSNKSRSNKSRSNKSRSNISRSNISRSNKSRSKSNSKSIKLVKSKKTKPIKSLKLSKSSVSYPNVTKIVSESTDSKLVNENVIKQKNQKKVQKKVQKDVQKDVQEKEQIHEKYSNSVEPEFISGFNFNDEKYSLI